MKDYCDANGHRFIDNSNIAPRRPLRWATPQQFWCFEAGEKCVDSHQRRYCHHTTQRHHSDTHSSGGLMAEFFSCIGATINNDLRQTNNVNPLATAALDQNHNGFKFQPITTIDVTNILKTLPNKKKGGIAQVPSFIYKIIGPYIIEPLTVLINKIMYTSTFPDIWKKALVTPIPKPGDSSNPSNYRQISSLPILSKIAEKTMASQIRAYLESNSLLAPTQYGFRENHSTESLLLQLTNNWLQTLDSTSGNKFISLTALDIKKKPLTLLIIAY